MDRALSDRMSEIFRTSQDLSPWVATWIPEVRELERKLVDKQVELEQLREAMRLDHAEGRTEVDKALREYGYDSLRFADVRHGWLFSTQRSRIELLNG